MRVDQIALAALLPLAAQAANIVLGNDDGWAEANQRTIFKVLTDAGNNVVQGAPAENQSGRSTLAPSLFGRIPFPYFLFKLYPSKFSSQLHTAFFWC